MANLREKNRVATLRNTGVPISGTNRHEHSLWLATPSRERRRDALKPPPTKRRTSVRHLPVEVQLSVVRRFEPRVIGRDLYKKL